VANKYPTLYEEPTEAPPTLAPGTLTGPIAGYWYINASSITSDVVNVDTTPYTVLSTDTLITWNGVSGPGFAERINTAIPERSDVWGAAIKGGSSNTAVSMSIALIVVDN